MSDKLPSHVYGVIIDIEGETLILPNSAVLDVLGHDVISHRSDGPSWLLGQMRLQIDDVPVISLEGMLGQPVPAIERKTRVVVLKAPSHNASVALLARSYPLIVTLNEIALQPAPLEADNEAMNKLMLTAVQVANRRALVPDLDALVALSSRFVEA
ncbi:MAG: chemotaxis protein CheW [Oceanococcus sp.]|nr:MAG: chemotaxis protein CheW [Oceanococcus sp.]